MHAAAVLTSLLVLGAGVSAGPANKRAPGSRTSTPSGCLTVVVSGATSGQYSSLSAAVASLGTGTSSSSACIFMYPGTYADQVKITYKGALTVYGSTTNVGSYTSNTVTITHSENSTVGGSDEGSSTVAVDSANFKMYNINVVNSYGAGTQAVALTGNADKQGYYGCSFKGYQDTLYAKSGYQFYSNCYIEGAVDYIFGDASAWFGNCVIASNGGGAITAMHRATTSETTWYVIDHSTIQAASGYASSLVGKVYLGRPWGVQSRVMYQYSSLSNIINAAGWTTMAAGATPTYEEYQNTGAGSSTSSRQYETTATAAVTMAQLWPNGYSWIDSTYL